MFTSYLSAFRECFRTSLEESIRMIVSDKCPTLLRAVTTTFNGVEVKDYMKIVSEILLQSEMKKIGKGRALFPRWNENDALNALQRLKEAGMKTLVKVCLNHALRACQFWLKQKLPRSSKCYCKGIVFIRVLSFKNTQSGEKQRRAPKFY